jgi:hypothetical protein
MNAKMSISGEKIRICKGEVRDKFEDIYAILLVGETRGNYNKPVRKGKPADIWTVCRYTNPLLPDAAYNYRDFP